MRQLLGLLLLACTVTSAHAGPPSGACDRPVSSGMWVECDSENVAPDNRTRPPVHQPRVEKAAMGSCGQALPIGQSYNARLQGVSCGTAEVQPFVRLPLAMSDEMREAWKTASALHDQFKMQTARKQEQKFEANIQLPMTESWTWQEKVGGFNSQFGTERYTTTCSVERTKHTSYMKTVTDYDNCIRTEETSQCAQTATDYSNCERYESESSGGSSGFGGGYSSGGSSGSRSGGGGSSGGSRSRGGDTGAGESRKDNYDDYDGSMNEYTPGPVADPVVTLVADRRPARSCARYGTKCVRYQTRCADYGTKRVQDWRHESLGTFTYSCEKVRPLWGEWLETRQESRSCRPQPVKYTIEYKTAPTWHPGYTDAQVQRSYHDSLPNQWDLLPGESEKVTLSPNQSSSGSQISPEVSICSRFGAKNRRCEETGWNEYQVRPVRVACTYSPQAPLAVNIDVETLGRMVRKAPNPLHVVGDGTNGSSLIYDPASSRPSAVILEDTSRTTMVDAAENSRTFGTGIDKKAKGASASGGYWQESRFRMRLVREFSSGRTERTSVPNTFGSNQGDIFDQTMTISLEGKDGLERLYRPGGPAEFLFGGLYKKFGVELTPGATYILKIALVQRGLPWYLSGCRDGQTVCEGEDGRGDSYSDELEIKFPANPHVDKRSFFKKFKDFQKHSRQF